jgi:signal transduction histidine kinase/HAMP domain-containing protein
VLAWRPPLPPLRRVIPLLLVLVAVLSGIFDWRRSTRMAVRQVEENALAELTQRMSELQQHLEFFKRAEQPERMREAIAQLGSDPDLTNALLLDEQDRVKGALRRVSLGQPAGKVHPPLLEPEARAMMDAARQRLAGQVRVMPGGQTAVACYPVIWRGSASGLTQPNVGILFVEMDLGRLKAQALHRVQVMVVQQGALMGGLAFLLWLFFHFVVTRRVNRLVQAARRFAARDWSARSGLHGEDELAVVGRAFDEMAERLRQTQLELEERELAQRFLIDASAQLAELVDVDTLMRRLARLVVPRLAQWCVIDTVGEEGDIRHVASVHEDASKQGLLQELERLTPRGWHALHPTAQVLTTGRPLLVSVVTEASLREYGLGEEHLRVLRELGLHSAISLPLTARGQPLGAILLASARPGVPYGPRDLALAQELAWRASIAVDNARLYRQAQDTIRLREEFLSVASHELHTPLTPLQLQLQTLKRALATRGSATSSELTLKLESALRQVKRLSRLVDDLLDVSRITAGRLSLQREEMDLAELTRELVERFGEQAEAAGCAVHIDAPGLVSGAWDCFRLEQVLVNLLSNALKYGAGRPVDIQVVADGGLATWSIRDQGIGIAPEHLQRIFGRFERAVSARAYGGLGLGLFIAHQMVHAHGGTLRVWSQPGAGSTFTVTLPQHPHLDAGEASPVRSGEGSVRSTPVPAP